MGISNGSNVRVMISTSNASITGTLIYRGMSRIRNGSYGEWVLLRSDGAEQIARGRIYLNV